MQSKTTYHFMLVKIVIIRKRWENILTNWNCTGGNVRYTITLGSKTKNLNNKCITWIRILFQGIYLRGMKCQSQKDWCRNSRSSMMYNGQMWVNQKPTNWKSWKEMVLNNKKEWSTDNMPQHSVEKPDAKGNRSYWFYLYEMFRRDKSIMAECKWYLGVGGRKLG